MLKVHEIFSTIQGEGYDTGLPCTFVRLWGCNLKCSFCDQPQAKCDIHRMSVESVVNEVRKLRIKNVCITGGEPLIQEELEDTVRRSHKYVMDIKCPSSGVSEYNNFDNLGILHPSDEVKFVIADRQDYDFMKRVLREHPTKAKVLLSPMFDPHNKQHVGMLLSSWVLKDRLDVRIQIQLHKVLGVQ